MQITKQLLTILLACFLSANAREITFKGQIGALIQKNCASCHRNDGPGPYAFQTFEQVRARANFIKYVMEKRIMPPWYADTSMHNIINQRYLSSSDIDLFGDWIKGGMKEGNEEMENPIEAESNFDILGKPDMILKMPHPHAINNTNQDEFFNTVLDFPLKKDEYLQAVKIVPGNIKRVHHARIEILDTLPESLNLNTSDIPPAFLDTSDFFRFLRPQGRFIYVPGLYYTKFPQGCSFPVHRNQRVILLLHYSPSNIKETDQTSVYLYFNKSAAPQRRVKHFAQLFADYSVLLQANQSSTVQMVSKPLSDSMSILSAQLHMHLIGKEMRLRAITPANDTIEIMHVPKWDFYWQEFYYFKNYIVIPKGSRLVATSVFDNTSENPNNPNSPPIAVGFGDMKTSGEMMGYILQYLTYRPGDEKQNIQY